MPLTLVAMGWSGWWIDASKKACNVIAAQLREVPAVAARLKLRQAFVSPENVGALLQELGVSAEVNLFSLDIDLHTYHVWAALKNFRPRVVMVEYNAAFPADHAWIHPYHPGRVWDGTQKFGASLKAFERLGAEFEYSLVGCDIIGVNAFFVRNDWSATSSSRRSRPKIITNPSANASGPMSTVIRDTSRAPMEVNVVSRRRRCRSWARLS